MCSRAVEQAEYCAGVHHRGKTAEDSIAARHAMPASRIDLMRNSHLTFLPRSRAWCDYLEITPFGFGTCSPFTLSRRRAGCSPAFSDPLQPRGKWAVSSASKAASIFSPNVFVKEDMPFITTLCALLRHPCSPSRIASPSLALTRD
jgi:hypothetical protein